MQHLGPLPGFCPEPSWISRAGIKLARYLLLQKAEAFLLSRVVKARETHTTSDFSLIEAPHSTVIYAIIWRISF
jgi:hypothetical protein